ncbi:amidohydrolase family protein [Candidatus Latescibacterota bacterium]
MAEDQRLRERFFREGKLDDCPVYDLHGHMGALQGACLPRCTPEAMIDAMDRAGVRLTVLCHHDALFVPEIGNSINLAEVRRFPDRFRAYCGINPNHVDQVTHDVETFDDNRDVYVGFKLLADYHKVAISDERSAPAWVKANADRLPILLHTWGGSRFDGPQEVRRCAERYPDAQILMGHSCHGEWKEAAQLARDFPNVYLELTAVLDDRGAVELFVREAGSEKIIFGTDSPWFNHHNYIGALLGAEMADDDRRNILYRNALRLLGDMVDADAQ